MNWTLISKVFGGAALVGSVYYLVLIKLVDAGIYTNIVTGILMAIGLLGANAAVNAATPKGPSA